MKLLVKTREKKYPIYFGANSYLKIKKILKKKSFLITDSDIKEFKTLKKIKKKQKLNIYLIGSKSNLFKIFNQC